MVEIPATNCTEFPGKEKNPPIISMSGNYPRIFFLCWELRTICTWNFPRIFPPTEIFAFIISVSGNTRCTVQTGKNGARLIPRLIVRQRRRTYQQSKLQLFSHATQRQHNVNSTQQQKLISIISSVSFLIHNHHRSVVDDDNYY